MIAPQINALGRLADARDAVKFMISSDYADVVGTSRCDESGAPIEVDLRIHCHHNRCVEEPHILVVSCSQSTSCEGIDGRQLSVDSDSSSNAKRLP